MNDKPDVSKLNPKKIKVLLVDDSPLVLSILTKLLSSASDIEVAGTASNGKEAVELVPQLNPAVICTDLHMPVMDGLEFTKEILAKYPRPILVVSTSVEEGSVNVFKLLEAGAVDVYPKPRSAVDIESSAFAEGLFSKIRILSGVRVFRKTVVPPSVKALQKPIPGSKALISYSMQQSIVVIGASTGGPQALRTILVGLPTSFPAPVICVQHIATGFLRELIKWLASQCRLRLVVATPGKLPETGTVYFAPEDCHLKFSAHGSFEVSEELPVNGHRPSVTVTMRSAAKSYGARTLGILLTGMGSDGAEGMLDIAKAGGITIAQDEASSVVFGMPKVAIGLGAVKHVLPLTSIAESLRSCLASIP